MPSTIDELRDVIRLWFGHAFDDGPVWSFLQSRGYTEDRGVIHKPTPHHSMSWEEIACVRYLVEEWGWGFAKEGIPTWYKGTE
jgi:hypothetical protein